MKKLKLRDQEIIKDIFSVILCMAIFCLGVLQFNVVNAKAMGATQGVGIPYVTRVDIPIDDPEPSVIFEEDVVEKPEEEIEETSDISEESIESGPRFYLSDYERSEIESLVMAESGAESYEGQMGVAQCILNACEKENKQPSEIAIMYRYTKHRPAPNESVKDAVRAVFDRGEVITDAKILYFYAPALVYSAWHESQTYVLTVGGHKFFAEA
jgi:hypothetical protein